jgi:hypothetical protein
MNDRARASGVCKAVERLVAQAHAVVLVAPSVAQVDALCVDLALLEPVRVTDVFARPALTEALSNPGRVVVATASSLPADNQPSGVPVNVIGWGRAATRAPDEAIAAYADRLGPKASVEFHMSLEDPLLAAHAGGLMPVLKSLRVPEDEAIISPMVSRAVENAQKKNA